MYLCYQPGAQRRKHDKVGGTGPLLFYERLFSQYSWKRTLGTFVRFGFVSNPGKRRPGNAKITGFSPLLAEIRDTNIHSDDPPSGPIPSNLFAPQMLWRVLLDMIWLTLFFIDERRY